MDVRHYWAGAFPTEPACTCSKLAIKAVQQGLKYVRRHQNDARWCHFTPCSNVSIVIFEHLIAGWLVWIAEAYSEHHKTSKMQRFAKIAEIAKTHFHKKFHLRFLTGL